MASSTPTISGSRVSLTGATGGLGGTIARTLDARGARLILSGRQAEALESLASQLRAADVIAGDLAERDQLTNFSRTCPTSSSRTPHFQRPANSSNHRHRTRAGPGRKPPRSHNP